VTRSPKDIGDLIREHGARMARDTMLLARVNLSAATPVDTGHATSNWVLSVGRPYTGIDGSREDVSFAAQATGDAEVREYDGAMLGKNRQIFIRNNVPYMKFLDAGTSQQAPPNFIAKALSGAGAARFAAPGTRRAVKTMLRSLALKAIKRGRGS
jgi:hypothetical protein